VDESEADERIQLPARVLIALPAVRESYAERWVRTVRTEYLDWLLIIGCVISSRS
jgi:hypothetical protein